MSKQPSAVVFMLGLACGLLLLVSLIGGTVVYLSWRESADKSATTSRLVKETAQRNAALDVVERMQRDGRPDEEIEAYAAKNIPGWRSSQ